MTTKQLLALAASAIAFLTISEAASAGTASLDKPHEIKHQNLYILAPEKIGGVFDSASQQATEYNTHRYYGGPKSND
jgi:hypothetical protein